MVHRFRLMFSIVSQCWWKLFEYFVNDDSKANVQDKQFQKHSLILNFIIICSFHEETIPKKKNTEKRKRLRTHKFFNEIELLLRFFFLLYSSHLILCSSAATWTYGCFVYLYAGFENGTFEMNKFCLWRKTNLYLNINFDLWFDHIKLYIRLYFDHSPMTKSFISNNLFLMSVCMTEYSQFLLKCWDGNSCFLQQSYHGIIAHW